MYPNYIISCLLVLQQILNLIQKQLLYIVIYVCPGFQDSNIYLRCLTSLFCDGKFIISFYSPKLSRFLVHLLLLCCYWCCLRCWGCSLGPCTFLTSKCSVAEPPGFCWRFLSPFSFLICKRRPCTTHNHNQSRMRNNQIQQTNIMMASLWGSIQKI